MPDTTITPNMLIPVPVPGVAPGPDWANSIVADMRVIDSHDHTTGKGVPITPDGLNISSDLPLGGNNVTEVRTVRFDPQTAALSLPTDLGCLYEVNDDLYYNDGGGTQIRITQSGSVTGSSGTITGLPSGTASASYSAGTFTFQSATSTPATMAVGPVKIGRQVASSKTVTLTPNGGQASDYDVTFPAALPASALVVTLDNTGALATTGTILADAGSVSAPSFSFASDPNTGMYDAAADGLAFASGGVKVLATSTTQVDIPVAGSVTVPSLTVGSDANTGLYLAGADLLGVTAGGSLAAAFSPGQLFIAPANAAAPGVAFANNVDTGIYRPSNNQVGVACAGANVATFSASGLNLDGGGDFKIKIVNCGSASGASGSLSAAHGLTLANIIGVQTVVRSSIAAFSGSDGSYFVRGDAATTNATVLWSGLANTTYAAYAIITYQ